MAARHMATGEWGEESAKTDAKKVRKSGRCEKKRSAKTVENKQRQCKNKQDSAKTIGCFLSIFQWPPRGGCLGYSLRQSVPLTPGRLCTLQPLTSFFLVLYFERHAGGDGGGESED